MKLLQPNFDRFVDLDGVGPVPRPVDIDQSITGFATLRTLRIYRFEPGSVIDGHAEEDEVVIIVLSGSVELTMSVNSETNHPATLAAAGELHDSACACAAYLPPHGAYRLVPHSRADIAYVRATPVGTRRPKLFFQSKPADLGTVTTLLSESDYAEKLLVRLTKIDATQGAVLHMPINEGEVACEALIHVAKMSVEANATIESAHSESIVLNSWDTVALNPGQVPTLRIAQASALIVTVLARP